MKYFSIKLFFINYFVFCLAYSQTSGKISGKIIDASSENPLVGANIIIVQTQAGISADEDAGFL